MFHSTLTYIKQGIFNRVDVSCINTRYHKIFPNYKNVHISKCGHIALFYNYMFKEELGFKCYACRKLYYRYSEMYASLCITNSVRQIYDISGIGFDPNFRYNKYQCHLRFKKYLSWPSLKIIGIIYSWRLIVSICKKFFKHKYVRIMKPDWRNSNGGIREIIPLHHCVFIL